MAWWQNIPLFLILCPLVCGVVCSVLKGKAIRIMMAGMTLLECVGMGILLRYTAEGNISFVFAMGETGAPFGNELRAGSTEALIGLAFSLVLLLSVTGGDSSLKEDVAGKRLNLYGAMIGLLTAAMAAIVFTNDLFTAYVFIEISTLSSCALISATNRGKALFSSARYMVMNLLGSGLFLLGLSMLYALTGQLLFPQLGTSVRNLTADGRYPVPMYLSFLLMTMGLCIKSALYPFHTWLPDAYSNSTAVSGALLSSLVSKMYIFLLIKIALRAALEEAFILRIGDILFLYAATGTVIGSVHAIRQHRLSRLIAYSSVAQIACVYLGISIGGTEGIAAALFYILAHSAAKSMLFLTAHKLRQVSGGADGLEDLRGAANRNRLAGLAFLTGACSLTGIPGLGGFAAKLYLAQAGIVRGGWRMPVLLGLLALSTVLNVAYMLRSSLILYSREDKKPTESPPRHDPMFAGTMIVQIGLNLFLGLCGNTVMELLRSGLALFI